MKKVLTSLLSVSVAATLFTACKKEAMPTPDESAALSTSSATANGGNGGIVVVPIATYVVTKYGTDSILYGADSRVAKVQHSATAYTAYAYGANAVTAKTYANNQLTQEVTYQLNPATGQAKESEWHFYSSFNGNTIHTQQWLKYEYNPEGFITKKYNKVMPAERMEYNWGVTRGILTQILFFGSDNKEQKVLQYGNTHLKTRLRMHMPATGLDPYLPIFGKTNRELPGIETHWTKNNGVSTLAVDYSYYYEMNADAYPIERHRSGGIVGQGPHFVEQTDFTYKLMP